jgi:Zn-dependent metalloprotease
MKYDSNLLYLETPIHLIMKKQIFTLLTLVLCTVSYAQKNLLEKITGEGGISNHFTRLSDAEQIPFNPRQARAALNLDPSSDLVVISSEADDVGQTHYRYYQTFNGIPVENTMYIAHVKTGKLAGISGNIITEFDNSVVSRMTASLSVQQAINTAVMQVKAKLFTWEDPEMEQALKEQTKNPASSYYPTATLVWFNEGDEIRPRELRLAYKVDVYARQPLRRAFYFIDAQSGQVLGRKDEIFYTDATGTANTGYSGTQTIHSDFTGSNYRLRDLTKGNGVITLHGESGIRGTDYTSSTASWTLTGTNQAAMDAHYGVSQTYNFYHTVLSRNSYDNKGTALTSYVNDPTYTDNAFWDGSAMNFCKRSNSTTYPAGVTGIDVTGHELTHGVTQTSSGLNYSKEPGAINESMSDIFGKAVQFWSKPTDHNWLISNNMNWNIRNMSNPNQFSDPDTYKGSYWVTSSTDNYGVHTNSGVGNFMFYLLVDGGSGTNDIGHSYSVAGIGLDHAIKILYRSNTVYLTPSSQYADWRQACINSAIDLYGAGSNDVIQVQNAWYAVGVGSAPVICTTTTTPSGLAASNITSNSATVSWTSTGASAYNLNWKPSSSSTWTTVSNITATSYNMTGLNPSTSYDFRVQSNCSGTLSAYSTSSTFLTAAFTYCASKGNTSYEYIRTVQLGTINNTSGNNGGYGNYTSLSTNLATGVSNTINLTAGFTGWSYTEYWTIYIDYNHNGVFESTETITTGGSGGTISKAFIVPTTAKNGPTRMRIQMKYASPSTNPCATSLYGEVEDYTVNISGGTGISEIVEASQRKPGISISPNPVLNNATVQYTVAKEGVVTLQVIDILGRSIESISLGQQSVGTHVYNFDHKLVSGNYIISLFQNKEIVGKTRFMVSR